MRWVASAENRNYYLDNFKEKREILQYDSKNNLIKKWNCIKEILKENPTYNDGTIYSNLCSDRKNAYGFVWKYVVPLKKKEKIIVDENEIFKKIPLFDEHDLRHYKISDGGNIKNNKGLIMKNKLSDDGYHKIMLTNKKTLKKHLYIVHRLVAITFIENDDPDKKFINHKDKNRANNKVDNLVWITRRDNNVHARGIKIIMMNTKGKVTEKFNCIADAN